MNKHQVVVIGAGYAGLLAALRLRNEKRAQVTLINASAYFVERIRLHQHASGQDLPSRPLTDLLENTDVAFVQGVVTGIQQDAVIVGNSAYRYDTLIYALGSKVDRDSVEGVREYAHVLNSGETGKLREQLKTAHRVLIIGGGLTGIEAATEFAETYPQAQVTLLSQGKIGADLSPKGREHLKNAFKRFNIAVCEDVTVQRLESGKAVTSAGEIPFDVCVWGAGFTVPTLARQAGIRTNERGQVIVDGYLRSVSHPQIYAVGDSAYVPGIRMACATAMPMGAHTADNIKRHLDSAALKPFRFGYLGRCISLGRNDGLVQMVNPDDSPRDMVVTGKAGALVKELICRFTVFALQAEHRLPGGYRWPQTKLMLA
jgi:NADH:ubiquinone reductase (H+-translocating)